MKTRYRAGSSLPILTVFLLALLPFIAWSGVCNEVERLESFSEQDRKSHAYFDQYYIRSKDGKHYILAIKYLDMDAQVLARVLGGLEQHAEFLPGYKRIKVHRLDDNRALTAIRFQPDFGFFESRFTNRLELLSSDGGYRQCWQQLDARDLRVIEEFSSAPRKNRGYWRVSPGSEKGTELRYFSNIKPPIPIPGFIYRHAVKNSYKEVFQSVINRARQLGPG